jgi:hypothetical protein
VREGEWVRVSWRSDGLEGGEVCGEAVEGSFVVFSNFVWSNKREICGADKMSSHGGDQVVV